MKMTYIKKAMITAVSVALCVVLPMAFHAIPNAGNIYCPMHLPVLLCGLVCGAPLGLVCGLLGPILSALITQMPPLAVLPPMLVELGIYGLTAGLMMRLVRTGRLFGDLYISLISAMVLGRIAAGAVKALIFTPGKIGFAAWATSYFVTALPGIIIQLVLLPAVVAALTRAKLIPRRYPEKK